VLATIRDTGRWRSPNRDDGGRGTLFMRDFSDELHIDHGPDGTNVVIRRHLSRAASR
jgi:anti-sigma regulatory factor (Ser/Thr protein kinase)